MKKQSARALEAATVARLTKGPKFLMRSYVIAFAAALSACSGQPRISEVSQVPVVQNRGLPPPLASDLVGDTRPYLIGPFDKLSISVFGVDELTRDEVQADASGQISFPLVGSITAAGHTPGELANIIAAGLSGKYVRDPQVSVNLKETVSQVISVDGNVGKPGLYPVVGNMTLMGAIATAGGLAEYANLKDVVVFRTVGNQRMAGLYNLDAIRNGVYVDPEIFANDVISVGESKTRRLFKDFGPLVPLITTPLVLLFR